MQGNTSRGIRYFIHLVDNKIGQCAFVIELQGKKGVNKGSSGFIRIPQEN